VNKPETTFIDIGRDDDLVVKIPNGYSYEGKHGGYLYSSSYKDGIEYAVEKQPVDTKPLANIEFLLQFTVAAASPATVDVKVRPINGTESDGPITLYTGNDVDVFWTATNIPVGQVCNCKCMSGTSEINCGSSTNSSCGSGIDTKLNPKRIYELLRPTSFKVTCQ
jgi:hypothetical protein